jgi:hypothetical protein
MKGKVLLGIVILVVGLIGAFYGMAGISDREDARNGAPFVNDQNRSDAPVVGDQNQRERDEASSMLIPVLAGVAIAGGAALIGIGMGAFRRPKIVPPNSPAASKAATTRPTTP